MIKTSYGLHWHGSLAFLHQQDGAQNALGLDRKSPFTLQVPSPKRVPCPHYVDLGGPDCPLDDLPKEIPLLSAFLPAAQEPRWLYIRSDVRTNKVVDVLSALSLMGSPIYPNMAMMRNFYASNPVSREEMRITNLLPMVYLQASPHDLPRLNELALYRRHATRGIVVVGHSDVIVPDAFEILGEDDVLTIPTNLPWQRMGATYLKKIMRRENLDGS